MWRWRRKVTAFVAIATAVVALGAALERSDALFRDEPVVPDNTVTTANSFP